MLFSNKFPFEMARSFHEEEEEALSFCDLPVKEKQNPIIRAVQIDNQDHNDDGDEGFDFKHGPPLALPMCAAEELFFQGHMLPLRRLSFTGSENALNYINNININNDNNFSRNLWVRSESMDHNLLRFRNGSSSSRSSSSRSHYSRSSSISNNSISMPTANTKPRAQKNNVFHSHPSPTPQIRSFSTSSHRSRSRGSSRWHFFRLGLLRPPGIMELHDLKNRTTTTNTNTATMTTTPKPTGSFLGVVSCKRSVEAIPPALAKSSSRSRSSGRKTMNIESEKDEKEKEKKEKEGEERRLSHRRTFEWLKQLSHATFADEH